ncbi:NACHT domain-containing protein [Streptomyces sp. 4N509B]|uniref:NACHT domain-containing protein n=1 Tax=Streptomyces sp. 4N509B TaxID=3457413 RepID=UPI003FCF9D82
MVVARAGAGYADPAGVLVGVASLVVAIWSARRAVVWQDTDAGGLADRLAPQVQRREEAECHRLLGGDTEAIDLAFGFTPARAHNAAGAAPAGRLADVAGYYGRLRPGRLVITGAPGAGKTVLAVRLMLRLLADRAEGGVVPVRLSLSGFDPGRQSLERWVIECLVRDYGLPLRAASTLVDRRLILPVLDGLDEMDEEEHPDRAAPDSHDSHASRAGAALREMNSYLDGAERGQLVVTCRSGPYAALEGDGRWIRDAARITIRPVSAEAAWDFLAARTSTPERWEPVLDRLAQDQDGPLARALSTPWRLTVAATVYDQGRGGDFDRDPSELLAPALNTEAAVRDHLLGLFIPAAAAATAAPCPASCTPDQARTWLSVLARYLHANTVGGREIGGRRLPGTDLVLHELWPLAGPRRARNAHTAVVFVTVLLALSLGLLALRSLKGWVSVGVIAAAAAFGLRIIVSTQKRWPRAQRINVSALRTLTGWRRLGAGFALGLVVGLGFEQLPGFVPGPGIGVGDWYAILAGPVVGLMGGFAQGGDFRPGVRPREVVRGDLTAGLLLGLVAMLVIVLIFGFDALFGFGAGFVAGFTAGLLLALRISMASVRYVAFLLCTRRPWARDPVLPFRLGRFLDWCCEAGLTRTAGIAYQFRHRELQDYLARTGIPPTPPGPSTSA